MDLNKNYRLMAAIKYSINQNPEPEILLKLVNKEVELEKQALNCCDKLDPEAGILFLMRYVGAMTWNDVARRMRISVSNCHKIHRRILKKISV